MSPDQKTIQDRIYEADIEFMEQANASVAADPVEETGAPADDWQWLAPPDVLTPWFETTTAGREFKSKTDSGEWSTDEGQRILGLMMGMDISCLLYTSPSPRDS